jgi:hypothetical protein
VLAGAPHLRRVGDPPHRDGGYCQLDICERERT